MRPLISACQRCGGAELRMPGVRDAVLVGLGQDLSRMACVDCGLVAVPLEFDDEAAWRAYVAARAKDKAKDWPASGWPSLRL